MANYRFKRQHRITPDELGLNGVTLAAERTSNKIDLNGNDELMVFVQLTRGGTATRVDVAVDVSWDPPSEASPKWSPINSLSNSSGTVTVSDTTFQRTTSVDDEWELRLTNLNHRMARIRVSTGAGGASASDTVIVKAIVSKAY